MGATEDSDSVTAPPVRGEIWDVDLEPAEVGELDKTRPVLVINAMLFDRLDTRVVVPLTTWRSGFECNSVGAGDLDALHDVAGR